jgi:hypothetical protein
MQTTQNIHGNLEHIEKKLSYALFTDKKINEDGTVINGTEGTPRQPYWKTIYEELQALEEIETENFEETPTTIEELKKNIIAIINKNPQLNIWNSLNGEKMIDMYDLRTAKTKAEGSEKNFFLEFFSNQNNYYTIQESIRNDYSQQQINSFIDKTNSLIALRENKINNLLNIMSGIGAAETGRLPIYLYIVQKMYETINLQKGENIQLPFGSKKNPKGGIQDSQGVDCTLEGLQSMPDHQATWLGLYGPIIRLGDKDADKFKQNYGFDVNVFPSSSESCKSKPSRPCILLLQTYFLSLFGDRQIPLDIDTIDSTGVIKVGELEESFSNNPFTVDPRQFLTIQRFTKFKKEEDKACFLFHGVGTGKTVTSLSIAMHHLSEENEFKIDQEDEVKQEFHDVEGIYPEGYLPEEDEVKQKFHDVERKYPKGYLPEEDKVGGRISRKTKKKQKGGNIKPVNTEGKPLKVLVLSPQGIFLGAFKGDLKKQAAYIYDIQNTEYSVEDEVFNLETFTACLKKPNDKGYNDQSFYKIEFTGFDYQNLLKKKKALDFLKTTQDYDVLICDEAHKIITEPLVRPPKSIVRTYDIELSDDAENPAGSISERLVESDESVPIISDVKFVKFIIENITKYSIFLTGTPLQKSTWDLLRVVKFMNIKEINRSNNDNLLKDIKGSISGTLGGDDAAVKNSAYADYYFNGDIDWKNIEGPGSKEDLFQNNTFLVGSSVSSMFQQLHALYGGNKEKDLEEYLKENNIEQSWESWTKFFHLSGLLSYWNKKTVELQQAIQTLNTIVPQIVHIVNLCELNELNEENDIQENKCIQKMEKKINEILTSHTDHIINEVCNLMKQNLREQGSEIRNIIMKQSDVIEKKLQILNKILGIDIDMQGKDMDKDELYTYIQNTKAEEISEIITDNIAKKLAEKIVTDMQSRGMHHGGAPDLPGRSADPNITLVEEQEIVIPLNRFGDPSKKQFNLFNLSSPPPNTVMYRELTKVISSHGGDYLNPFKVYEYMEQDTHVHPEKSEAAVLEILRKYQQLEETDDDLIRIIRNVFTPSIGISEIPLDNTFDAQRLSIGSGGMKKTRKMKKKNKKTVKNIKSGGNGNGIGSILSKETQSLLTDTLWLQEACTVMSIYQSNFEKSLKVIFNEYMVNSVRDLLPEETTPNDTLVEEEEEGEFGPSGVYKLSGGGESRMGPFMIQIVNIITMKTYLEIQIDNKNKNTDVTTVTIDEIDGDAVQFGGARYWKDSNLMSQIYLNIITKFFKGFNFVKNLFPSNGKAGGNFFQLIKVIINETIRVLQLSAQSALVLGKFIISLFTTTLTLMFNNNLIGPGNWNYNGIIKHLLPFVSVYNYDYLDAAISQEEFYNNLQKSCFNVNTVINKNGNKNNFPQKFIENIYVPFKKNQNDNIDNYILEQIQTGMGETVEIEKVRKFNIRDKYLIESPAIDFSSDESVKFSYKISNSLSNLSFDIPHDGISREEINASVEEYQKFSDTLKDLESSYTNVEKYPDEYEKEGRLNDKFQFFQGIASIENIKNIDEIQLIHPKFKARGINISSSFQKKTPSTWTGDADDSSQWNILEIPDCEIKEYIKINVIAHEEGNDDNEKIENLKVKTVGAGQKQSKFDNVISLLKSLRTGMIFHNGSFVLHPHYVTDQNENEEIELQYYLPVVYPLTKDIMYGFARKLQEEKINFIWMDGYTMDPETLDNNLNYGRVLTYPIKHYDDPITNPVCVLLSPDHKEGFSFTFNPCLISLGLSDTAGDEEQIYGRVLRKYGVPGKEPKRQREEVSKDPDGGRYSKKIYQYFSGGDTSNNFLKWAATNYSSEITSSFRFYKDIKSYVPWDPTKKRGVQGAATLPLYSTLEMSGKAWNGVIRTFKSIPYLVRDLGEEAKQDVFTYLKRRKIHEDDGIVELDENDDKRSEENYKYYSKNLDRYFINWESYRREMEPDGEDKKWKLGPWREDDIQEIKKLTKTAESYNSGSNLGDFIEETQFKILYKAREDNLQFFTIIASIENCTTGGYCESNLQSIYYQDITQNPFAPIDIQFIRNPNAKVEIDPAVKTVERFGGTLALGTALGTAFIYFSVPGGIAVAALGFLTAGFAGSGLKTAVRNAWKSFGIYHGSDIIITKDEDSNIYYFCVNNLKDIGNMWAKRGLSQSSFIMCNQDLKDKLLDCNSVPLPNLDENPCLPEHQMLAKIKGTLYNSNPTYENIVEKCNKEFLTTIRFRTNTFFGYSYIPSDLEINEVIQGGQAEKAGMQPGWKISSVNGKQVTTDDEYEREMRKENPAYFEARQRLADSGKDFTDENFTEALPTRDPQGEKTYVNIGFRTDKYISAVSQGDMICCSTSEDTTVDGEPVEEVEAVKKKIKEKYPSLGSRIFGRGQKRNYNLKSKKNKNKNKKVTKRNNKKNTKVTKNNKKNTKVTKRNNVKIA